MNDALVNQLTMIGATIIVAEEPQYRPVWESQSPQDFGTGLAALKLAYAAAAAIASQASFSGDPERDLKL